MRADLYYALISSHKSENEKIANPDKINVKFASRFEVKVIIKILFQRSK